MDLYRRIAREADICAINQHVATLPREQRLQAVIKLSLKAAAAENIRELEQKTAGLWDWTKKHKAAVLGGLALLAGAGGGYMWYRDQQAKNQAAAGASGPPPPTPLDLHFAQRQKQDSDDVANYAGSFVQAPYDGRMNEAMWIHPETRALINTAQRDAYAANFESTRRAETQAALRGVQL